MPKTFKNNQAMKNIIYPLMGDIARNLHVGECRQCTNFIYDRVTEPCDIGKEWLATEES